MYTSLIHCYNSIIIQSMKNSTFEHRARVWTHALQQVEPVDADTSLTVAVLGVVLHQLSEEELLLFLELLRPT